MPPETVAVIAFDQINPFLLSIPCTVFREDYGHPEMPSFKLRVCSCGKRVLQSNAGFTIGTNYLLAEVDQADIVIVPSWRDPDERPPERLLLALQRAHQRGAVVVGLCLGTFVLAAAGLLDNRPATTHWGWTDDLARRYPLIAVRPEVLYVDEGDVITSAGVAAGIDCCLHILRKRHGAEVAARVAKRMVVPPHRQGGQAQYIEQPLPPAGLPERFAGLLDWLLAHLDRPHSLDSLAARLRMSRRTFTRHFQRHTGTTVGAWLLNQRLALAQQLLEQSDLSLALIAERAGFGSEVSLRQQFAKVLTTSPSRYRKEFRHHRAESASGGSVERFR